MKFGALSVIFLANFLIFFIPREVKVSGYFICTREGGCSWFQVWEWKLNPYFCLFEGLLTMAWKPKTSRMAFLVTDSYHGFWLRNGKCGERKKNEIKKKRRNKQSEQTHYNCHPLSTSPSFLITLATIAVAQPLYHCYPCLSSS